MAHHLPLPGEYLLAFFEKNVCIGIETRMKRPRMGNICGDIQVGQGVIHRSHGHCRAWHGHGLLQVPRFATCVAFQCRHPYDGSNGLPFYSTGESLQHTARNTISGTLPPSVVPAAMVTKLPKMAVVDQNLTQARGNTT